MFGIKIKVGTVSKFVVGPTFLLLMFLSSNVYSQGTTEDVARSNGLLPCLLGDLGSFKESFIGPVIGQAQDILDNLENDACNTRANLLRETPPITEMNDSYDYHRMCECSGHVAFNDEHSYEDFLGALRQNYVTDKISEIHSQLIDYEANAIESFLELHPSHVINILSSYEHTYDECSRIVSRELNESLNQCLGHNVLDVLELVGHWEEMSSSESEIIANIFNNPESRNGDFGDADSESVMDISGVVTGGDKGYADLDREDVVIANKVGSLALGELFSREEFQELHESNGDIDKQSVEEVMFNNFSVLDDDFNQRALGLIGEIFPDDEEYLHDLEQNPERLETVLSLAKDVTRGYLQSFEMRDMISHASIEQGNVSGFDDVVRAIHDNIIEQFWLHLTAQTTKSQEDDSFYNFTRNTCQGIHDNIKSLCDISERPERMVLNAGEPLFANQFEKNVLICRMSQTALGSFRQEMRERGIDHHFVQGMIPRGEGLANTFMSGFFSNRVHGEGEGEADKDSEGPEEVSRENLVATNSNWDDLETIRERTRRRSSGGPEPFRPSSISVEQRETLEQALSNRARNMSSNGANGMDSNGFSVEQAGHFGGVSEEGPQDVQEVASLLEGYNYYGGQSPGQGNSRFQTTAPITDTGPWQQNTSEESAIRSREQSENDSDLSRLEYMDSLVERYESLIASKESEAQKDESSEGVDRMRNEIAALQSSLEDLRSQKSSLERRVQQRESANQKDSGSRAPSSLNRDYNSGGFSQAGGASANRAGPSTGDHDSGTGGGASTMNPGGSGSAPSVGGAGQTISAGDSTGVTSSVGGVGLGGASGSGGSAGVYLSAISNSSNVIEMSEFRQLDDGFFLNYYSEHGNQPLVVRNTESGLEVFEYYLPQNVDGELSYIKVEREVLEEGIAEVDLNDLVEDPERYWDRTIHRHEGLIGLFDDVVLEN